jgi:hypothetical protein
MEPEGSTPCSQEPSTGPYPEPYQSNPLHPIILLDILKLYDVSAAGSASIVRKRGEIIPLNWDRSITRRS